MVKKLLAIGYFHIIKYGHKLYNQKSLDTADIPMRLIIHLQ